MPVDLVLVRRGRSKGNQARAQSKRGDASPYTERFRARRNREWRLTDVRAGAGGRRLDRAAHLADVLALLHVRGPVRTDSVPARQRAGEASLRQRLQSLRDENRRLREENHSLKTELALAYGQQRDARSR